MQVSPAPNRVTIVAESMPTRSACPFCGDLSGRVHSRYTRTLVDLPWQGRAVGLFGLIVFAARTAGRSVTIALQSSNGNNNNYLSFIAPQQNLAETVLNQQINIPPALEVNQGDPVTIFVGHNINFGKVYRFRTINGTRVLSGEQE